VRSLWYLNRVVATRLFVVFLLVGSLELASRMAWINPISFIPPSRMVKSAWFILLDGTYKKDMLMTIATAGLALFSSVVFGSILGLILARFHRFRRVVDPLLLSYYAVPIFVVYPMFIVLFGLNRIPLVMLGFLFAIVAMAVNTLNGLERVPEALLKTSKALGMSAFDEIRLIKFPASIPFLFTGIKLSIVYSFIAVIAGEFLLAGEGFGFQIAFAYNNFDNDTMYGLMVLLLVFVGTLNLILHNLEQRIYQRRVIKDAV